MKTTKRDNYRIEVYPRDAGDFGGIKIGGMSRAETEERDLCKEIARQIKRHVDDVSYTYVICDTTEVCEHCGSVWTEETTHNGGCCSKDIDEMERCEALAEQVNT